MGHVFISYSREEDQPYARKLADELRTHDIEVWLVDDVDYGDRWWRTIVKQVRTCAAFIVLMTPEADQGGRYDTSPVGRYSPKGDSPYGVADMAGNVWEWCADWFDATEYKRRADGTVVEPEGPQKGGSRVLRGGSFDNSEVIVRCGYRGWSDPDIRNFIIGFRIVMIPSSER